VTEEARETLQETQIRAAMDRKRAKRAVEEAATAPAGLPAHVAKAKAFADFCRQYGWEVKTSLVGDLAEVQARRGTEAIHQAWENGVYHPASATYTVADRTVMTRNAAAAKRYAERAPEDASKELQRVASNKSFRRRETAPAKMRLPFDPATATDREIIDALAGKGVAWHNRFRQVPETAQTPRDPRRMRIEEQNGERVVLFCCPVSGFRAFRLSALTRVGRAKHPTKGQPLAEVVVD
jgi:hypothetical protein